MVADFSKWSGQEWSFEFNDSHHNSLMVSLLPLVPRAIGDAGVIRANNCLPWVPEMTVKI